MPQGPYDQFQMHQPPSKDNAPGPLQRPRRDEPVRLDELHDAILELTAAIHQLSDSLAMEHWSQSYGPSRRRQSDPVSMRPVSPFGQAPGDPDIGR